MILHMSGCTLICVCVYVYGGALLGAAGAPTLGCVCSGVSPLLWASGGQQGGTGQFAVPYWLLGRGSGLAH